MRSHRGFFFVGEYLKLAKSRSYVRQVLQNGEAKAAIMRALLRRHGTETQWDPRAITDEKLEQILAALQRGTSKLAVCRAFGVRRRTLIDTLQRVSSAENLVS